MYYIQNFSLFNLFWEYDIEGERLNLQNGSCARPIYEWYCKTITSGKPGSNGCVSMADGSKFSGCWPKEPSDLKKWLDCQTAKDPFYCGGENCEWSNTYHGEKTYCSYLGQSECGKSIEAQYYQCKWEWGIITEEVTCREKWGEDVDPSKCKGLERISCLGDRPKLSTSGKCPDSVSIRTETKIKFDMNRRPNKYCEIWDIGSISIGIDWGKIKWKCWTNPWFCVTQCPEWYKLKNGACNKATRWWICKWDDSRRGTCVGKELGDGKYRACDLRKWYVHSEMSDKEKCENIPDCEWVEWFFNQFKEWWKMKTKEICEREGGHWNPINPEGICKWTYYIGSVVRVPKDCDTFTDQKTCESHWKGYFDKCEWRPTAPTREEMEVSVTTEDDITIGIGGIFPDSFPSIKL